MSSEVRGVKMGVMNRSPIPRTAAGSNPALPTPRSAGHLELTDGLDDPASEDNGRAYLTRADRAALRALDPAGAAAMRAAYGRVGRQLLAQAVRVAVHPSWTLRTWPGRRYPRQCYGRTADYVRQHPRIPNARLVHGVASHAPAHLPFDHAWVELPGEVVFDGVVQAFFTRSSYYAVMSALNLDSYSPAQAEKLRHQHGHPGPWNAKWVPTPAHLAAYAASLGQAVPSPESDGDVPPGRSCGIALARSSPDES